MSWEAALSPATWQAVVDDGNAVAVELSNENLDVVSLGQQGPQGPQGDSGDKHYAHTQLVPSAEWTITHNLNKYPAVTVVDSAGSVVTGDVDYTSANELVVSFSSSFGGKAYLN